MSKDLNELPSEILDEVLSHVDTAQSLCNLSQTCKNIHSHVQSSGFHIFVKNQFPCLRLDPKGIPSRQNSAVFWKDAACAMSALAVNWDRRALLARQVLHPKQDNTRMYRPRRPQRMGFIPVLDSYQDWNGGKWSARRDVVAWGAGSRLMMRSYNPITSKNGQGEDARRMEPQWRTYDSEGVAEGRDDILTLNLIPHEGKDEMCIIGRASGDLSQVRVGRGSQSNPTASYVTEGRPVRSSSKTSTSDLLATCLSDRDIAIYDLTSADQNMEPLIQGSIQDSNEKSIRTWTCDFLSRNRLAVGCGYSRQPIRVFDLEHGNLNSDSARRVNLAKDTPVLPIDFPRSSAFKLAPLPHSSASSDAEGELFLSGAFDGIVRYVHVLLYIRSKAKFSVQMEHSLTTRL